MINSSILPENSSRYKLQSRAQIHPCMYILVLHLLPLSCPEQTKKHREHHLQSYLHFGHKYSHSRQPPSSEKSLKRHISETKIHVLLPRLARLLVYLSSMSVSFDLPWEWPDPSGTSLVLAVVFDLVMGRTVVKTVVDSTEAFVTVVVGADVIGSGFGAK
ncbi:hypothetical protein BS50DRAFT_645048 [Corynespora cassiicola Philippines]|uniref:Uncharacterized protein n=1 Tax=Corynespora cassiicola Philippines TaxID=1448308 RepID=A0A2T2NHZ9_CORCC|nr:hypothetical protein BS50DRAFT_645048 [Corynespora cassiicola Philippines]